MSHHQHVPLNAKSFVEPVPPGHNDFVGVMRELSLIILLITPSTRVLMTVGFNYAEEGLTQLSNALVLIVAVLTIIGELILLWFGKGKITRLREKHS